MTIAAELKSKPIEQTVLEVCAGLAATYEDWSRAAEFFGMAEERRAETGAPRDLADEAFLAPLMNRARRVLAQNMFAEAEARGRNAASTQAVALARTWLEARRNQ
jgi:hypothetical protein